MVKKQEFIYQSDEGEEENRISLEFRPLNQQNQDIIVTMQNSSLNISNNERTLQNQIIPIDEKVKKTIRAKKISRSRDRVSHKWNPKEHKKYINFFLITQIKRPYLNLSWSEWKINNIYPQAAQFIGIKQSQVKSYDQRMKYNFGKFLTFREFIQVEAKDLSQNNKNDENDENDEEFKKELKKKLAQLQKIKKEKSKHMILAQKRLKSLKEFQFIINSPLQSQS